MLISEIILEAEPEANADTATEPTTTKTAPLEPESGNYTVDPKVKQMQSQLQNLGYDLGPPGVDGKFGPYTQAAVTAFKKDYRLSGGATFGQQEQNTLNQVISGQIKRVPASQAQIPDTYSSGGEYAGSFKWAPGVDKRVKPEVLSKLAAVQKNFGLPLTITSGYRDPKRNTKAGGASGSAHLTGEAVDVSFAGDQNTTNHFVQLASQAGFGGIGVYKPGSVHVDIKSKRAWGPTFKSASVPAWARGSINQHLA